MKDKLIPCFHLHLKQLPHLKEADEAQVETPLSLIYFLILRKALAPSLSSKEPSNLSEGTSGNPLHLSRATRHAQRLAQINRKDATGKQHGIITPLIRFRSSGRQVSCAWTRQPLHTYLHTSGMSSESESEAAPPPKKAKHSKRSRSWTDDETRCLLDAWLKYRKLERTCRTKHEFRDKIVEHLKSAGFHDWDREQVRKRMDNLRTEYRSNTNPRTGSAGKESRFRKELFQILKDDYYDPKPSKFRETATPSPGPDATLSSTLSGQEESSSENRKTPDSFRSTKTVKKTPESRKRLLELYEEDVETKKQLLEQAKLMNQNTLALLQAINSRQSATAPAPAVAQPASATVTPAAQAVYGCQCGICNVCTGRSSQFFFGDFNGSQQPF